MNKYLLGAAVSLGAILGASGAAQAQAAHGAPAPGTLVVHLNGLIDVQMNDISTSVDNVGGSKVTSLGMSGYLRIYPGFDATTKSGFEYGADSEMRTAYTAAGTGMQEGSSSSPSGNVEALVVRRAWVYFGMPQYGYVRAGQTNSPWDLLSTGEYYNWGDHNGFNSDGGVEAAIPSGAAPSALFTSTGAQYTTDKLVYLSPKLMGFQAGVSFEPNSNAFKEGQKCAYSTTTGYSGCSTVISAPGAGDPSRRQNTMVAAVEYKNKIADFGVDLSAAYLTAKPALRGTTDYQTLGVAMIGGEVSYAGFLLGGNVKWGQINNGYHFLAPGARDALFYELTGEYGMGPYRIAVTYFNNQAAGGWTATNGADRTEADFGVGAGLNYDLAKGVDLYAMYLYDHRHQAGFDLVTGAAGAAYNSTQANSFTVGTVVTW